MKGSDIVKHIASELPKYTDYFSTKYEISSLTNVGTEATLTFASPVSLSIGSTVFITGAKPYLDIQSIERVGNIVTVTTTQEHPIARIDNRPNSLSKNTLSDTITIEDATPAEYNGTWQVYTALDDFTIQFKIATQPTTPATINGQILFNDFDNFNGQKTITEVVDANTYKYSLNYESPYLVKGDIYVNQTRVCSSITLEQFLRSLNLNNTTTKLEPEIVIVIEGGDFYKSDGTPASDTTSTKFSNTEFSLYHRKLIKLYAVIPYSTNDNKVRQSAVADNLHNDVIVALHRVLGNATVPSPYNQHTYESFTLVDYGIIEEKTYCICEMAFNTQVYITNKDVYQYEGGTPLKNVDVFFDNSLEAKVKF